MGNSGDRRRLWLKVEGRVQGVYFRASTAMEAKRLGLKGWVKNCSDGSVELIAEGDLAMLEELEQWCRQGPPGAVVRRVERRWEDLTDEFDDFLIKR